MDIKGDSPPQRRRFTVFQSIKQQKAERPPALRIDSIPFNDERRVTEMIDDVLSASPRISEMPKIDDMPLEEDITKGVDDISVEAPDTPKDYLPGDNMPKPGPDSHVNFSPKVDVINALNPLDVASEQSQSSIKYGVDPGLTTAPLSGLSGGSRRRANFSDFSAVECWKYVFFIVIFTCMVSFGRSLGQQNYHISHEVQRSLTDQYFVSTEPFKYNEGEKSLEDVDQYFEIYDWMKDILIKVLLPEIDTNNVHMDHTDTMAKPETIHLVAGQNRILGAIQIRQLRVKEETCLEPQPEWTCYPAWSEKEEATKDIVSGIKWKSKEELNEVISWWGVRSSYQGSGYAVELPLNQAEAIKIVDNLKNTKFIDRATRWIVNDFVLYNPELNLHCIGRISFELPASGGVIPSFEVKSWNFYRYEGRRGRALMAFEIIFCCFVLYFTFEEVYEFKTEGWAEYKEDRWNFVDIINLFFFYLNIAMRIREIVRVKNMDLLPPDNTFVNFRDLAKGIEYEAYLLAVNGTLMYLKLFKYMTFSKRIRFLFEMLGRSSNDLLIFFIVLIVIIVAFANVGFIAFSTDVEDFRSLPHAIINLGRYFITELPYDELRDSNRAFGSFYFCVFQWVMLMILANVFIAILCDAYADVIAEVDAEGEEDALAKLFQSLPLDRKYLTNKFGKIMSKFKVFGQLDADKDGRLDASEIAEGLSISKNAANDIVEQFDVDDDGQLDEKEYAQWLKHKEEENMDVNPNPTDNDEPQRKWSGQNQVVPLNPLNVSRIADDPELSEEEADAIRRMERLDSMVKEYMEQQDQAPEQNNGSKDELEIADDMDAFVQRLSQNQAMMASLAPEEREEEERND